MFPYGDPTIVAGHQEALRRESERERLAAMARRHDRRPDDRWFTRPFRGVVIQRLGRLVAAAR